MLHIVTNDAEIQVVPSGIATDYTYSDFFTDLVERGHLESLYDFENRKGLFPGTHRQYKFSLLTLSGGNAKNADFAFFLHTLDELSDDKRHFTLSSQDLALINPNTRAVPILRTRFDADLIKNIYKHIQVLVNEVTGENPWSISFLRMFDMTNDSHLFYTKKQLEKMGYILSGNIFARNNDIYLPLYEGKMIYQFDHRFANADVDKDNTIHNLKGDPNYSVIPKFWINQTDVSRFFDIYDFSLGFRGITNPENERTTIAAILPRVGCGNSLPLIQLENSNGQSLALLAANLNTFIVDWIARTKTASRNMNFFIVKHLPILPPDRYTPEHIELVVPKVLELTYTAYDLETFALDCGYNGPPFKWNEESRLQLRCELDAIYAHLYSVTKDELDYILETFPIVKKKDIEKYGVYRTKDLILEYYDEFKNRFEDD